MASFKAADVTLRCTCECVHTMTMRESKTKENMFPTVDFSVFKMHVCYSWMKAYRESTVSTNAVFLFIHKCQEDHHAAMTKGSGNCNLLCKSNFKGRAHSPLSTPNVFGHLSFSSPLSFLQPFHINHYFMYTSSKLLQGKIATQNVRRGSSIISDIDPNQVGESCFPAWNNLR